MVEAMTDFALVVALGAFGVACGIAIALSVSRKAARERLLLARAEATTLRKAAQREASSALLSEENAAREQALALEEAADAALAKRLKELAANDEHLAQKILAHEEIEEAIRDRKEELAERDQEVKRLRELAASHRASAQGTQEELRRQLEKLAGASASSVVEELRVAWIEDAQAEAAQTIRAVEQSAGDAVQGQEAHRLMSVASSRYQNHFLTERSISNVPLELGVSTVLVADQNRILDVLAHSANTKLNLHESGESLRLEGLDGVGREVARRALKALGRKPKSLAQAKENPELWVQGIRSRLDEEIERLGRKAFKVLKVPPAHPEIVTLVGKLNYRTSYTQNQWLHAVEAAFLAGMMAEELGLDIGLARRSTLLHDIGKALTHEIEGSHAVIGADIARRLGESEIVANAIGSHHADEPANSAYAFLVAAADAMSGARPGARREQAEGFNTRLEDLERLGASYKGVEHCAAVHGGRELRIYVSEKQVSDLQAFEMSSEIAAQISDELVFPGQVKVTVIRSSESVAVAM